MADPVTDWDKDLWFKGYIRGRELGVVYNPGDKIDLTFPSKSKKWTWQQKGAYRNGIMTGFTLAAQDANRNFVLPWAVPGFKWE